MAFAGWIDWQHRTLQAIQAERFVAPLGPRGELQVEPLANALFAHRLAPKTSQGTAKAHSLFGDSDRSRLLFSGYLSNREDLAGSLRLGPDAGELSDSGYVRLALERWGAGALERLEGAFALAFWNRDSLQLLLSTDHMGFRPLYYHLGDGWLAFATTPTPILTLPGVPRLPDEQRLACSLVLLSNLPDRSYFADIPRVPAASTAIFSGDAPVVKRYWQPDFHRRLHYRRDEDYVEAARELLDRAVRGSLCNTGPVVAEVSGGLDSSAVAATASVLLKPSPINTLTGIPDEGISLPPWVPKRLYLSEQPYVEAIAKMHPNIHPYFLIPSSSDFKALDQDWATIFQLTGTPHASLLGYGWFNPLFEHARGSGASTILSGIYGNISLSWDGQSGLTSMAQANQWSWVLNEARALSRNTGQSLPRLLFATALRAKLPSAVGQAVDCLRRRSVWANALINPEFAEALDIPEQLTQRMLASRSGSITYRRMLFESAQCKTDHLELIRRLSGCDYRHPLADRRLLEFCFAVPENQYLRNGVSRFLARRVLADRLPPEVINNTQRGMQVPDVIARMNQQRDVILAEVEVLERSSLVCRILDVPRMKNMAAQWIKDPVTPNRDYYLFLYQGLHYAQFLRWIEKGVV